MGRSTSEGNIQWTITIEGIMEGDTSKGKIGINTSESNMHGMGNKQTQITFYSNKSLTCSI